MIKIIVVTFLIWSMLFNIANATTTRCSYYGNESGRHTASGQRFNQNKLTAAHRTLPFGTVLCVSRKNKSVRVTVNDRGPFVRGRGLDLSTAAARILGLIGIGVGTVEYHQC